MTQPRALRHTDRPHVISSHDRISLERRPIEASNHATGVLVRHLLSLAAAVVFGMAVMSEHRGVGLVAFAAMLALGAWLIHDLEQMERER